MSDSEASNFSDAENSGSEGGSRGSIRSRSRSISRSRSRSRSRSGTPASRGRSGSRSGYDTRNRECVEILRIFLCSSEAREASGDERVEDEQEPEGEELQSEDVCIKNTSTL